jgi:hypothetical protein
MRAMTDLSLKQSGRGRDNYHDVIDDGAVVWPYHVLLDHSG